MDDQATTCPRCGAQQLNATARFCHRCGEPIARLRVTEALAPASAPVPRVNPLTWIVPLTVVLAAAALVVLWRVVFVNGPRRQTPVPYTTATRSPFSTATPLVLATLTPGGAPSPTFAPTASILPTITPPPAPSATLALPTNTPISPTPTWTRPPSGTPTPTGAPAPYGTVSGTDGERLNVRMGPGVEYDIAVQLDEGTLVLILGRNAAGDWLKIRCADGTQGWVARRFIATRQPIDRLPVMTPEPTPTRASDPRFRADRTQLTRGECTTLRWDVDNVREVYLDNNGVAGHGSQGVCLNETHTYTLTVVQTDGVVRHWPVTIEVIGVIVSDGFAVDYRGCKPHDMQLGQVKGQVFDRNGRIIVNAYVTITVDGQAGAVPAARSNESGWYEFNLKDGQMARFVRLEVGGREVSFEPAAYEVKARSGCYQRVDFRQQ